MRAAANISGEISARVATDISFVPLESFCLYSMTADSHDSLMRSFGHGWLILVCTLIATVACAAILVRSWTSDTGSAEATSTNPSRALSAGPAPDDALGSAVPNPNPAVQKAGRPDPGAQRTAAASAESAARAAAELATSASSSTN